MVVSHVAKEAGVPQYDKFYIKNKSAIFTHTWLHDLFSKDHDIYTLATHHLRYTTLSLQ